MRNRNWRRMALLLGLSLGVTGSLCTGCGSAVSGTAGNYNEINADADVLSASGGEVLAVKADISGKSYGGSAEDFIMGDEESAWREEKAGWVDDIQKVRQQKEINMRKFYQDTLACFLADGKEENTVYSPINVYLALAMLAESGEGETQEEILDLLQIDDLDALREYVNAIWNATYDDTPESTSLLANSIWLSDRFKYNKNLFERLSEDYHASAFIGTMGTEKMNQALHDWINENTKDLLKDSADGIKLDKATVMEILSTIYFKARWDERFLRENTNKEIFHGKNGDTEVDMMHRSTMGSVYQTAKFKGVSLKLSSGTMHFILPEENVKLSDVVKDEHIMDFLEIAPVGEERKAVSAEINLSIPKFDLSSKINLKAGLKALGVEKAFDSEQAEFQTLFAGTKDAGLPVYVDKAEHAAMVTIDEDGATGAAYTDFGIKMGAALPEETVDFVVDRPFYYVITSEDGSILFAGTAYDI